MIFLTILQRLKNSFILFSSRTNGLIRSLKSHLICYLFNMLIVNKSLLKKILNETHQGNTPSLKMSSDSSLTLLAN